MSDYDLGRLLVGRALKQQAGIRDAFRVNIPSRRGGKSAMAELLSDENAQRTEAIKWWTVRPGVIVWRSRRWWWCAVPSWRLLLTITRGRQFAPTILKAKQIVDGTVPNKPTPPPPPPPRRM